jgi:hypothetical protein
MYGIIDYGNMVHDKVKQFNLVIPYNKNRGAAASHRRKQEKLLPSPGIGFTRHQTKARGT